jgi:defect-in-organelle-trafficking protein DotB
VAGPTGSGKSTLLAAINRKRLETRSEVMITHESPIEFIYDEVETDSVVNQREIGHSGNYKTFYEALVGALRQDPDLILVGEARDRETINAAIHGVQTGHTLFTTVHTQGVAQTINRIVKEFEAHEREAKLMDIIDSIAIIVYQNLVPSLDGKRVALREYLIFDGEVKDRLRESPINALFTNTYSALIDKGQTLLISAKKYLESGRIDENIYRKIEKQFEADISKMGLNKTHQGALS